MKTDTNSIPLVLNLAAQALVSQALYVAAKLGVADAIAEGSVPPAELARGCAADESALRRVLRSLSAHGVFFEEADGRFKNTPGSTPLRSKVTGSLRDLIIWIGEEPHWSVYGRMLESVKTGAPAWEGVHGKPVFEYLAKDNPALGEIFHRAMTDFSRVANEAVLDAVDFDGVTLVADIGGGAGHFLEACLRRRPALRGVVFDRPEVASTTSVYLEATGLGHRAFAVEGNFFESVPVAADLHILKHILHDWSDADALRILKNLRRNGCNRLWIIETVLSGRNEAHFSKTMDLDMLVSAGGCERSGEEFRALLHKGGYALQSIKATASPLSVLEAFALAK